MKKFPAVLAMILALFPMLGALSETAPQTKEGTIYLEGIKETVTLTLFESELGYRLWYDAALLAPAPEDEGGDTFVPASPDAVQGVSLGVRYSSRQDYTLDNAGPDTVKSLTESGYAVTAIDTSELFPACRSLGFHAAKGESILDTYILEAGEGQYYITASYPLAAAEGFGGRLHHTVKTFEILYQQDE